MTSFAEDSSRPMNNYIDLDVIKKIARKDLIASLQKFPGSKAIVWDRALTNFVNLVATHSDFKEHCGVTKMLSLEQKHLQLTEVAESVVFICRPLVHLMQLVASAIGTDSSTSLRRTKYHILFLPSTNLICTKWLEDQGVLPLITSIEELPLFLFPLDSDVLTMEMEGVLRAVHGENDASALHHVAKALVLLQRKYGSPTKVFGKGHAARHVYELMEAIKNETGGIKHQICGSKISNLILIDRQVDLLSPLVTQLTYEGLIDEFFGINGNQVKLPSDNFEEPKAMLLNSSEDLYAQLRDRNFSAVGGFLRVKTKEVQEVFKQKNKAQNVGEMKKLVQQLHSVNALKQSLTNHTTVAELLKAKTEKEDFLASLECEQELLNGLDADKINQHIENLCIKKAPLISVLRLFLIQSITSGGLKPKVMQHYERLILQNYGFEQIFTLEALHSAGFISTQVGTGRYSVLRRALTLTVCDGSETRPEDFAYVHSIYAPLSIRLVQHRLKPSLWLNLKDSLNSLIPGPTVDEHVSQSSDIHDNKLPSTTVVVFIGGCTLAEISALRFLAKQEDEHEFLVVTTRVINGNTLMTEFLTPAK